MPTSSEIAVSRSVTVPLAPERAFRLFTTHMEAWWPPEHHIGAVEMAEAVLEPRVGGRWYERGVDGSECEWGKVAAWDPPGRVVLLWQIGADWKHDPTLETEVVVQFVAEGAGTRVELEHRYLERFGEAAEQMRAMFEGPGAWGRTLERFAALAQESM